MLVRIEPRHWAGRITNPVAWAIREQCKADGEIVVSGFDMDGIASIYHNETDVSALYPSLTLALSRWAEHQEVPARDFALNVWLEQRA